MSEELDNHNWCMGYLKGLEIMSNHKQEIIEALLRDLKWLDLETMVSEEQNKIEGIIAKWESRLK